MGVFKCVYQGIHTSVYVSVRYYDIDRREAKRKISRAYAIMLYHDDKTKYNNDQ